MASRMLHYVMALELAQELKIKDRNRFLVGALLPDASSHSDGSYNVAHFYDEATREVLYKGVNWKKFAQKYADRFWTDDLCLGYLCHLIMDAVWFHDVADKYVRIYEYPERARIYQKGYGDFNKLNVIMRREYGLENPKLCLENIYIEEVQAELLPMVFGGFEEDFTMEGDWKAVDLELYPYDVLQEYMEKCRELCLGEIETLRLGMQYVSCEAFFSPK